MRWTPDLVTLAQHERGQWNLDRAKGCGVVRFSRMAGPTVLEDGTILPDFTLDGAAPVSEKDGKDTDDRGRMWVDFYAVNPQEIVQAYKLRIAWDAFADRIGEFEQHPRMLAGHNVEKPIGNWPDVRMTREGTWMRGFISAAPGTPAEMQGLARDRAIDGSIGFDFTEADFNEEERVLEVRKGVLIEGSLVGIPAMKSSFVRVAHLWARDADRKLDEEPPAVPAKEPREIPAVDWDAVLGADAVAFASLARARVALAKATGQDAAGGGMGGGQ